MEDRISFFLNGITPDGYCSEGVGYWNYGFGHYILLADTIYQATAGKIDMMANKHVEQIANYARRIEILPGESPAFADCHPGARPDLSWMAYLSRRYGWGLKDIESAHLGLTASISSGIASLGILGFPNAVSPLPTADAQTPPALRDWFSDAGVLICRPGDGTSRRFAVALKGGHNAEHHNHNDVGSFVVAIDGKTPLLDPGSEVYTARTFSSHRYDSAVLNSFGHPVPRVAGQLQVPGREAAAKVLKADFTDDADTLVLDLASAYKVKELKKLVRTFVYSRQGNGKLTVTDEVEFDSPQQFGAALITYSPWKQLDAGHLTVGESPNAAQVALATTSGSLHIVAEELHEDMPDKRIPTRLGIDLVDPVKAAAITLTIAPE
jgi:hypothetical protein